MWNWNCLGRSTRGEKNTRRYKKRWSLVKSEMAWSSLCERRLQAGRVCAVENNKWGNKHGWENQGRNTEAIKGMKCFNRVAVDTVPYEEPALKQKAFFSKSLSHPRGASGICSPVECILCLFIVLSEGTHIVQPLRTYWTVQNTFSFLWAQYCTFYDQVYGHESCTISCKFIQISYSHKPLRSENCFWTKFKEFLSCTNMKTALAFCLYTWNYLCFCYVEEEPFVVCEWLSSGHWYDFYTRDHVLLCMFCIHSQF